MDEYINLLSEGNDGFAWDDTQHFTPTEEQHFVPTEQEIPSSRPNNKRTKNFNEKEDLLLVSAWLNISTDAVHGNEQSRSTYWSRIHQYFHENKDFESDRIQNSLLKRWCTIQENVNKFCGCYDRIERRRQSGTTEHDKIVQACSVFAAEEKKAFAFLHCWNVLRHHPKWTDRLSSKKQKTTVHASPGSSASTPSTNSSQCEAQVGDGSAEVEIVRRPSGRNAEKERLRRGKGACSGDDMVYKNVLQSLWSFKTEQDSQKEQKKEERYARHYALEEERIENEKLRIAQEDSKIANERKSIEVREKELELKMMLEEERIMNMNTSAMCEAQKEYYIGLQNDIIARRRR